MTCGHSGEGVGHPDSRPILGEGDSMCRGECVEGIRNVVPLPGTVVSNGVDIHDTISAGEETVDAGADLALERCHRFMPFRSRWRPDPSDGVDQGLEQIPDRDHTQQLVFVTDHGEMAVSRLDEP